MKALLYVAIAVGVLAVACQSNATEKTANPAAAIEPTTIQWIDSIRDMGTVNEGQVVDISYRFKNTGTKPLVIKKVNVSCGCTVAEKPEEPIAPGQEGLIKASFNSSGKPGRNNKSIFVYANTGGSEEHKLEFSVEVTPKKQ
ncbi:DUF1573 domain-containing protein [Paraflavitalea soli]|uniref:DUF1573 domain-containing protein n=1 Tax=Paraflavitalea soli TaxID=2315862 RepID=A0A3B7MR09_9BACT|nr:DUF1573 domain-containing protein [Paraflavitalea soli]AXY73021.1 DUF1573 domain-containing protein [Paraflavitalea soli]